MQADGKGWLFAPSGLQDGPLPAHYEPSESPVRNPLYSQQANPTREVFPRKDNLQNPSPPEANWSIFPYVFTTYRLTEHHTAGGMSRWVPYLTELQPEFFCEVSPELAQERGLEHLGWATIVSARTAIEARVLVTDRMVPLTVDDRIVHQVGLPYHWGVGSDALVSGDSANDLFGVTLDPNVHIQESKVASCDIVPGRRPTGPALLRFVEEYRSRAGITVDTGNTRRTPEIGRTSGSALRTGTGRRGQRRMGRTRRHARGSSPTPRSASAARPARWPARSGTAFPTTGSTCWARRTTTPARSGPPPGGTSPSSSSRPLGTSAWARRHAPTGPAASDELEPRRRRGAVAASARLLGTDVGNGRPRHALRHGCPGPTIPRAGAPTSAG